MNILSELQSRFRTALAGLVDDPTELVASVTGHATAEAAAAISAEVNPLEDSVTPAVYKKALVRVLTEQALRDVGVS